ncbi:MAG: biotin-independent malonate decarboxylase subunit gamma [Legionella sp.]|nr:MAG: biotin-independent malonate decarboxylase subunit gamma [Legionella sp.]PJD98371.1 MAG: biotin-independent malonate decarboxylase subunit gamma [Legionella sp.]
MTKDELALQDVLSTVFDTHQTHINQHIVFGSGQIKKTSFNILGTTEHTSFGVNEALAMAHQVLNWVHQDNKNPIILLTDVAGQKLSMRDEWLGMYAYFAHLLKCLQLARYNGNRLISLVYNQAIGGSFIAFGMMADHIFALKQAKLAVMWLEGMAKVTKIDMELLAQLSQSTPVFAPGVDNFKKLGGLHKVLALEDVAKALLDTLQEPEYQVDDRAKLGKHYGGRTKAYDIIQSIERL